MNKNYIYVYIVNIQIMSQMLFIYPVCTFCKDANDDYNTVALIACVESLGCYYPSLNVFLAGFMPEGITVVSVLEH